MRTPRRLQNIAALVALLVQVRLEVWQTVVALFGDRHRACTCNAPQLGVHGQRLVRYDEVSTHLLTQTPGSSRGLLPNSLFDDPLDHELLGLLDTYLHEPVLERCHLLNESPRV